MKGVSVIVCCYNSSIKLPETLKHLAFQEFAKNIPLEIILVNNSSTDDTEDVAKTEWKRYNSPATFKIINEEIKGLSAAREKGVRTASYETVIFCDDDNWLEKNYIQTAYEILESHKDVGAVGGRSEAVAEVAFPDWWEKYKEGYAVGNQVKSSGILTERNYLWGSGVVIRKSLLLKIFSKDVPLLLKDRTGKELTAGGDSEMCNRVLLLGMQLYYDERLQFTHFISASRLTEEYRDKLYAGFEQSSVILKKYRQVIYYYTIPLKIKMLFSAKTVIKFTLARLGLFRQQIEFLKKKWALSWIRPDMVDDLDIKTILLFVQTERRSSNNSEN